MSVTAINYESDAPSSRSARYLPDLDLEHGTANPDKKKPWWKGHFTLKLRTIFALLYGFFLSVLFSALMGSVITAWNDSNMTLAQHTYKLVQNNVRHEILAFLQPVKVQNLILDHALTAGNAKDSSFQTEPELLRDLMYNLVINVNDTSTKCGRSDGTAVGVVRRGKLLAWHITDISNQTNIRRSKYLLDGQGDVSKILGEDKFDIRTLKWWRESEASQKVHSWSSIFFSNLQPDPKLAATLAKFDTTGNVEYMISSDISLNRVNGFLDEVRTTFTDAGVLWLMQRDYKLVGSSAGDSINVNGVQTDSSDSVNALIRQGADSLKAWYPEGPPKTPGEVNDHSLKFNGNKYHMSFSDVEDEIGLDWVVVSLIPEKEILGDLKKAQTTSYIILSVVVIVAVVICWFGLERIAAPMARVSQNMTKVSRMELDGVSTSGLSFISEIHDVQVAFDNMKQGLLSFQKYVPASLVRTLMLSGTEAELGLKLAPITTLFMDLENFTTLSESLADRPHILTRMLSEYFGSMSDAIVGHKGTVDKYIGDAIMAFWNAPNPVEDHELEACKAALECKKRLKKLHKEWAAAGLPLLNFRIGINSGPTFVGNVGAETRMDYTVVGDSVNTASRLENVNKQFGTRIIISGEMALKVAPFVLVRPLADVTLKGKTKKTSVFELVAMRSEALPETVAQVETYQEAHHSYCQGDFKRAETLLTDLAIQYPELKEDRVLQNLLKDASEYVSKPPPLNWLHEDSRVSLSTMASTICASIERSSVSVLSI